MAACRKTWFYILVPRQQVTVYHTEHNFKARLHGDRHPPTRPHLLIVPLPMSQAFKCMIWGAIPIPTTTPLKA